MRQAFIVLQAIVFYRSGYCRLLKVLHRHRIQLGTTESHSVGIFGHGKFFDWVTSFLNIPHFTSILLSISFKSRRCQTV